MAAMIREDLAAARAAWLEEVRRDPEELVCREQSDFLAERNHDGEIVDFQLRRE